MHKTSLRAKVRRLSPNRRYSILSIQYKLSSNCLLDPAKICKESLEQSTDSGLMWFIFEKEKNYGMAWRNWWNRCCTNHRRNLSKLCLMCIEGLRISVIKTKVFFQSAETPVGEWTCFRACVSLTENLVKMQSKLGTLCVQSASNECRELNERPTRPTRLFPSFWITSFAPMAWSLGGSMQTLN